MGACKSLALAMVGERGAASCGPFAVPTANAAWDLDFWGKYRRGTEAARAQLLSTDWARQEVIATLVAIDLRSAKCGAALERTAGAQIQVDAGQQYLPRAAPRCTEQQQLQKIDARKATRKLTQQALVPGR